MSRMNDSNAPKIRFEITEDRPEDSPSRLAIELAEQLTLASVRQRDSATFSVSAQAERTKAQQLQSIIFQLKERKRNPIPNVSRMDPLNEYSMEQCEAEFALLKERAQDMQQKSDLYAQEAKEAQIKAEKLQKKIHDINVKLRSK